MLNVGLDSKWCQSLKLFRQSNSSVKQFRAGEEILAGARFGWTGHAPAEVGRRLKKPSSLTAIPDTPPLLLMLLELEHWGALPGELIG